MEQMKEGDPQVEMFQKYGTSKKVGMEWTVKLNVEITNTGRQVEIYDTNMTDGLVLGRYEIDDNRGNFISDGYSYIESIIIPSFEIEFYYGSFEGIQSRRVKGGFFKNLNEIILDIDEGYWMRGNVNPSEIYITYDFNSDGVTLGQTFGNRLQLIDWASSPFGDD